MYIYVGNLSVETVGSDLRREFEAFGEVSKAAIITDLATSVSAGFGFVKMASQLETAAALKGMVGKALHGNILKIRRTRRVADTADVAKN
jgi:RNA recognition motif-containing protein